MIWTITPVDPARRAQWLIPSAVRYVNQEEIRYLLPVDLEGSWRQGDLLLGQVRGPLGMIASVQNTSRGSGINYREAALFPGSKVVAVLAPREGSSTCVARVPEIPVLELHLHGVGGQAGVIVPGTQHTALYQGAPTRLEVLALLGGTDQKPLNMRSFAMAVPSAPTNRTPDDPALILVVGSDMDAGKTTVARRVIYALRAFGHEVVAGKASGVASLGDIASMYDAGASEVIDFTALGEAVTIGLPRERVLTIFHQIFNYLRTKVGPGGFVVIELADGIWYRESRLLLEDESVRRLTSHVVLACHGILDAENGIAVLGKLGYGEKLRAISGKLGSSGVLRAAALDLLGSRWPVFDSLDYESTPGNLAALFDTLPEASERFRSKSEVGTA